MTRVDFYILAGDTPQARDLFACRVVEKAYRLGHGVYLHTASPQQAERLDRLLWTFKQNSFVPHAVDGHSPDPDTPVLIGYNTRLSDSHHAQQRQVLINLAADVPLFFSSFERVAEIIDPREEHKISGRARYRFYRDRGYNLENHNIG